MREIQLTNGGVALVDDDDFERIAAHRWQRMPQGYAYRCERRRPTPAKVVLMHRVVLMAPPDKHVDHVNGVKADNRKSNLRLCTRSQNLANRTRQPNNKGSRYKGVTWTKEGRLRRPWRARCRYHELGWFATEIEAAAAYNARALEIYGEFAVLNDLTAETKNG